MTPDRETVLSWLARASSGEAKRRIARKAFDAHIISLKDFLAALKEATRFPDVVRAGTPGDEWLTAEDDLLRRLVRRGVDFATISTRLNRTRAACIGRAYRLGLKHPEAA